MLIFPLIKHWFGKYKIDEKKDRITYIKHDLVKNPEDLPPKKIGAYSDFVITNIGICEYIHGPNAWFIFGQSRVDSSQKVLWWHEIFSGE